MKYLSTLAFLYLALAGSPVFSAEVPADKLRDTVNATLDVLYPDSEVDKQAKVRELIEQRYDMSVIIRRAIGRNWTLMNDDEQERVVDLVKRLIIKSYVDGLQGKARPDVTFELTVQVTDKRLEISSTVLLDGKAVHVLYRLGRLPNGWQIYDIVAEDISVVSNYRQQFDDHFRKGTGAELIEKLEELLKRDEENGKITL
jgi:phospholipid transport system substrate-binding protein